MKYLKSIISFAMYLGLFVLSVNLVTAELSFAEESQEEPIRFGILASFSGEMAGFGKYAYNAANLATKEINEAGGPLNRKIELYREDDESSVEQGIRGCRKLITQNEVIAINGPVSDVITASMNYAKESEVVIASPYAGSTKLDKLGGKYQFRTCPSDSFDGKASAQMLMDEGYQRIAIMHVNDEGSTSVAESCEEAFKELGGEVVSKVSVSGGKSRYLSELKKAFKDDPEILFLAAGQDTGPTIIKNWNQRGYGENMMVTADLAITEFFDLVSPEVAEGFLGEMPITQKDSEEYKRFAKKWEDAYDSKASGAYQANAYDAQIILALAIEAAGEASGKAIAENYRAVASPPGKEVISFEQGIKELRKGNEINYQGASGPCDFDKYGNVMGSYALLEAKDGEWIERRFYPAEDL